MQIARTVEWACMVLTDDLTVFIRIDGVAIDKPDIGMPQEALDLEGSRSWHVGIIRVEPAKDLATTSAPTFVHRIALTFVGLAEPVKSRIMLIFAQNADGFIRASAIDDPVLDIGVV